MPARFIAAWRALWVALAPLLLVACSSDRQIERGPVILAASSLQESLEEIAALWSADGRPPPVLSFAATSALARQIGEGAPADVFVSADQEWMDTLEAEGRVLSETRRDIVGNRLVLIRARGSDVAGLADMGEGKLAMADPEAVPAGRYAKAALESSGQWPRLVDRVVPAENVRSALVLVERREVPLAVVYVTDAMASAKVEIVEHLPETSHPPIRYPAALVTGSTHPEAADFLEFLTSPEARPIFQKHGFRPLQ